MRTLTGTTSTTDTRTPMAGMDGNRIRIRTNIYHWSIRTLITRTFIIAIHIDVLEWPGKVTTAVLRRANRSSGRPAVPHYFVGVVLADE